MYTVSLFEDSRVLDVYDTEVYVDVGVEIFEISNDDFQKINASGRLGDWRYVDGAIVYAPLGDVKDQQIVSGAQTLFTASPPAL